MRRPGLLLLLLFTACSVTELPPRGDAGLDDGGALDGGEDGGSLDAGTDGGPVPCTFRDDLSCSTHDWEPVVGACGSDGLCYCTAHDYFRNEVTGLCRWGECDMIMQDCPDSTHGCYPPGDGFSYPHCLPAGETADGSNCLVAPDCIKGSTCEVGRRICSRMCDPDDSICPQWQECQLRWARMGMPGLCL